MWQANNTLDEKTYMDIHNPEPIKISSMNFEGINLYSHDLKDLAIIKEVRIYTDNAKTKLYKPSIVSKINKMIREQNNFILKNLPKRIRNTYTKRLKVTFITLED